MWTKSQASQADEAGEPESAQPRRPPRRGRSWRACPCRGSGTGGSGRPAQRADDVRRPRARPPGSPPGRRPGTGRPSCSSDATVADDEDGRRARERSEIRLDQHAAGAVERHAERARERRGRPPRPPTARCARRGARRRAGPRRASTCVTGAPAGPRTPSASSWQRSPSRTARLGKGREHARPASTRTTRASVGSMWRKSRASVWRAISASAPASSTPVGPPPMTTKVSQRPLASAPSSLALRGLEGEQHAPADLERVLERLEAGRAAPPTRRGRSRSGARPAARIR